MKEHIITILVEIPAHLNIKYEWDEKSRQMTVDHILPEGLVYPENYGFIMNTKSDDGDAADAVLFTSQPVESGSQVTARVIGMLDMEDEHGVDHKFLCVPIDSETEPDISTWHDIEDIPQPRRVLLKHFFQHHKDQETNGWTRVNGFVPKSEALSLLIHLFPPKK